MSEVTIEEVLFGGSDEAMGVPKPYEGTYLVTCEADLVEGDTATTQTYLVLCEDPDSIVHTMSPRLQTRTVRTTQVKDEKLLALLRSVLLP